VEGVSDVGSLSHRASGLDVDHDERLRGDAAGTAREHLAAGADGQGLADTGTARSARA
jgi:hypothetical protein